MRATHALQAKLASYHLLPRVTSETKKEFDLQVNSFSFRWYLVVTRGNSW